MDDNLRIQANMLHKPYLITRIDEEADRTRCLVLDRAVEGVPGQFAMLWLPHATEKAVNILSVDPLILAVNDIGLSKEAINALQAGDTIWVRGPLGHGYCGNDDRLLLVGGGYSSAPLVHLAANAIKNGKKVDVILAAKKAAELPFTKLFDQLGVQPTLLTDDGSAGKAGLLSDVLREKLDENAPKVICAAGPNRLMEEVAVIAREYKIKAQISWEGNIRCGMGLCGICELKRTEEGTGHPPGWLVCHDGPVSQENMIQ
ncbi:MAG TPA: hypothetical protein PKD55_05970 [Bellilinea sp.]|nr:hypothetical protein [Bellilinea sp.]